MSPKEIFERAMNHAIGVSVMKMMAEKIGAKFDDIEPTIFNMKPFNRDLNVAASLIAKQPEIGVVVMFDYNMIDEEKLAEHPEMKARFDKMVIMGTSAKFGAMLADIKTTIEETGKYELPKFGNVTGIDFHYDVMRWFIVNENGTHVPADSLYKEYCITKL